MHYKTVWRIYMLMLGSEKSKESITRGFAIAVIFTICLIRENAARHDLFLSLRFFCGLCNYR